MVPFRSKLLAAAVSACGATLPAAIGVCLGREDVGYVVASFGAYLVTITHTELPIEGRAPRLASTIFMLCMGAIAGASAGQCLWLFLSLAAIGASWQAWTEIADTALRFPAAIAVLTLLVSTANDPSNIPVATYGAAFGGGTIWQGLVQYIGARPSDKPPASLASDLDALIFSLARARQFMGTMATLGAAGGAIASSLTLPHAAWLLTTALRVMKPSQAETRLRLQHRFIGTSAGALVSAGLLGREIPPLLYAGLFGIMLTAMQLVGGRRYAVWTFCLTVIALDLGQRTHEVGWQGLGEFARTHHMPPAIVVGYASLHHERISQTARAIADAVAAAKAISLISPEIAPREASPAKRSLPASNSSFDQR